MKPALALLCLLAPALSRHVPSRDETASIISRKSPQGVPPDFECAWRSLALSYAAQLQPQRPARVLADVYDALQLGPLCNQSFKFPLPQQGARPAPLPPLPPLAAAPSSTLYVDAALGSDANSGSEAAPLAHLATAVQRARALPPPAAVILRASAPHRLRETLTLTAADSGLTIAAYPGEAPVITSGIALNTSTWRRVQRAGGPAGACSLLPGENAMYGDWPSPGLLNRSAVPSAAACQAACAAAAAPACTAFIYYDSSGPYGPQWSGMCFWRTDGRFVLTPEASITSGRCQPPPAPPANIYATDLAAAGTPIPAPLHLPREAALTLLIATAPGEYMRPIRARYPNCDPEVCQWPEGWASGGAWLPPVVDYANVSIAHVPFPRNMRGENQDYWQGAGGTCAALQDGDGPAPSSGNASYWCQPNGRVGGKLYFFRQPTALTLAGEALPHAPYAAAPANGAVLHYFRPGHWYSVFARIANATTTSGGGGSNATRLSWTYGGFHGAEGTDSGEDWVVDHVAEELDAPREFYYEWATGTLYYFHNASAGTPPPEEWAWEAPSLPCLINISGAPSGQPAPALAANITLSGLTLTGAAATFLHPHGLPGGGDWAVARIGAVTAEGSTGLVVSGCVFTRLDGNALVLNGWNRGAEVDGCEFSFLGESGVVSWGRVVGADARGGMQPWGTRITRNVCREIGVYEKQVSCYFATLTGGAHVSDNLFYNMPRAAINFNDDLAGGSLITRNLLFNTCRESQDHGPFNSWGRTPYIINYPNGTDSGGLKPSFDEISYNFLVAGGGANSGALDHDDGSAFYKDHHNFQVYGGHKSNFDGHSKRSAFNLYAFALVYANSCGRIFPSLPPPSPGGLFAEAFTGNTCILGGASDLYFDLGHSGCTPGPALASQMVFGNNTLFAPPGASAGGVKCGGQTLSFDEWVASGSDPGSTLNGTLPSSQEIVAWARALLQGGWA